MSDLTKAETERDTAIARLTEAQAKTELQAIESMSTVMESWSYAGPHDREFHRDDMDYGQQQYGRRIHRTSISDRTDGRYLPYYETEQVLSRLRAQARNLAAFTSVALGAAETLADYVIGTGWKFTVLAKGGGDKELAARAQGVIDEVLDDNQFVGDMDREIHQRSTVDGEALVALYPHGDKRIRMVFHEPDNLTEPASPLPIERWMKNGHKLNYWKYGVHTQYSRQMHKEDPMALGYHFVFDETGEEWDYLPLSRVEHFKRNTGRNAKRGVSDYLAVIEDLEREAKLRRNIAEGAAILAAIAFIREHAPGVNKSSIESMVANNANFSYNQTREASSKSAKVERFGPGTVKDIPNGLKYVAGPMGQVRSPIFIEVAQYILRSIGIRWSMPEYIVSGDASNSNFASTLVSESPFVKARERDQAFYKRGKISLLWKIVRLAWEIGRFGDVTWDAILRTVEIHAEPVEVASRDKFAQSQTNEIENRNGILSRETWATETGRDYVTERANIENEPPPADTPPDNPAVRGALTAALESVETSEETRAILHEVEREYP